LVSAPYIDLTIAMMEAFGVRVDRAGPEFEITPQVYQATEFAVEPDASTASYFLAAAAVTGRSVTIPGLGSRSAQGDLSFGTEVLTAMGCSIELSENSITLSGPDQLRGGEFNMRDISDTMPTLAAIAPFADAPVTITDIANVRLKECDRLDAMAFNLRSCGIRCETGPDWITVYPGQPHGAEIACYNDHRIAMACSVLGLRIVVGGGITLDNPLCVAKTCPDFYTLLGNLRSAWEAGS
jgi:3-phosphoshikimate 1-carboxyvinyltransferase